MRRRKLKLFFALVLSFLIVLSLVACGGKHTHDFSSEWQTNETHHWHAAVCEHTDEVADKNEHSFNEGVTTLEPTVTEAGVKTFTCSVCQYTKTEVIPPLSGEAHTHSYKEETVSPTCAEKGYTKFTCECGVTYKDKYVDKIEHTVSEWSSNNDGTHSGTCTLGHTVTVACSLNESVTNPDCEHQGYTTYLCSVCNYSFNDDFVNATGHEFDTAYVKNDSYHWHSATCSHTNEKSDYAQHTFNASVTLPTCTEKGYTTYTCTCGYSYVSEYVDAPGHSVEEWLLDSSVSVDVTKCEFADTYTGVCTVCNKPSIKTELVEKHSYYWAITTPATCVNSGIKAYICANEGCKHNTVNASTKTESYSDTENHVWIVDSENSDENVTAYKCNEATCTETKKTVHATDTSVNVQDSDFNDANEITLPDATIGFDSDVKNKLSGSGQVSVSAETLDGAKREEAINNANISPEQKEKLEGKEIYSFTVSTSTESNINKLGGFATIRIPYTLGVGENPDDLVIWYISGGELEMIPAVYSLDSDGNGFVTFTTDHFSDYVISDLTPEERCAKDGHVVTTFPATCRESGHSVCTRCGAITEVIPPTGHNWHSEVNTNATCTTNGQMSLSCLHCDEKYNQIIPAQGHYYVIESHSIASCTEAGISVYGCVFCEDEYSVTVPVKEHIFSINVVAPTCTELGYTEKTCTVCGLSNNVNHVQPLGHKYSEKWSAGEEGHYHVCTVCGNQDSIYSHTPGAEATEESAKICTVCEYVITPPLAHKHTLTKVDAIAPSCLEGGNIEYYVCSCGKWFKDSAAQEYIVDHSSVFIDATGHSLKNVSAKDPGCTEPGYTSGVQCTVCEKFIRGHIEISPMGHSYQVVVTPPTCDKGGYTTYTCHCGDTKQSDPTEPLGHKIISSVTAPSCESGGYTTDKCLRCSYTHIHSEKDSLGHSFGEKYCSDEKGHYHACLICGASDGHKEHIPDYPEANEYHGIKCIVCDYEIAKAINHVHTPIKRIEATDATCTSAGNLAYYTCSCGSHFLDEACTVKLEKLADAIIKPTGHSSQPFDEIPPTCTDTGVSGGIKCSSCGTVISGGEILPTTGHNFENGICKGCGKKEEENVITVLTTKTEEKTTVTISVSSAKFAAISLTVYCGDYKILNFAGMIEGAAVNEAEQKITLVWFSEKYENTTSDIVLLTAELEADAIASIYVNEIYTVFEDGNFKNAQFKISYENGGNK